MAHHKIDHLAWHAEEKAQKVALLKEDLHTPIKMLKSRQKKRETEEKTMQYSLSAYARCDEGDEFYVSLTPGITPDGKSFLKRTVVEMNDDLWDTYSLRLERAGVRV